MRKKIIGFFVCMLMIAAVVIPAAGTIVLKNPKTNGILYPCSVPNDPNFNKQWYLHNRGQLIWYPTLLFGIIPIKWFTRGLPDADINRNISDAKLTSPPTTTFNSRFDC